MDNRHGGEQSAWAEHTRALRIALCLNAAMFVVDTVAGLVGRSSGLLADGLDMLADAAAFGVALLAMTRTNLFKGRAAFACGLLLVMTGPVVIVDAIRRWVEGIAPEGRVMIAAALVSLTVNLIVLRMMRSFRTGEVHLRTSWIFTRADVIANLGVIGAALLVMGTGSRVPDVAIGIAIGSYVIKEAFVILREARNNTNGS